MNLIYKIILSWKFSNLQEINTEVKSLLGRLNLGEFVFEREKYIFFIVFLIKFVFLIFVMFFKFVFLYNVLKNFEFITKFYMKK